jgi:hypothetical protein
MNAPRGYGDDPLEASEPVRFRSIRAGAALRAGDGSPRVEVGHFEASLTARESSEGHPRSLLPWMSGAAGLVSVPPSAAIQAGPIGP